MGKTAFKFLVDSLKIAILVKQKRERLFAYYFSSHRMWVMTIWMRWWTKLLVPSILQCFWHSLGSDCKGRTQKTWYETHLLALMRPMSVRTIIDFRGVATPKGQKEARLDSACPTHLFRFSDVFLLLFLIHWNDCTKNGTFLGLRRPFWYLWLMVFSLKLSYETTLSSLNHG